MTELPNFKTDHTLCVGCLEEFNVIGWYSIWLNGTLDVVVNLQQKLYGVYTRYSTFSACFLLCFFPPLSKLKVAHNENTCLLFICGRH